MRQTVGLKFRRVVQVAVVVSTVIRLQGG
jgi:hypothetical protein